VLVESPFAGDIERNVRYARACVRDCLLRNEYPYASHLFYTQDGILDDDTPDERILGINAGLAWGECAAATIIYTDLGITNGMKLGIERAQSVGRAVEYRTLPEAVIKRLGLAA